MYYELVILNVMILKYLVHFIIESNNCLLLEWRSILLFHIFFLFQLITMLPVTTPGLRPTSTTATSTFKNYLSLEDPESDATDRLDFKYELRCF